MGYLSHCPAPLGNFLTVSALITLPAKVEEPSSQRPLNQLLSKGREGIFSPNAGKRASEPSNNIIAPYRPRHVKTGCALFSGLCLTTLAMPLTSVTAFSANSVGMRLRPELFASQPETRWSKKSSKMESSPQQ